MSDDLIYINFTKQIPKNTAGNDSSKIVFDNNFYPPLFKNKNINNYVMGISKFNIDCSSIPIVMYENSGNVNIFQIGLSYGMSLNSPKSIRTVIWTKDYENDILPYGKFSYESIIRDINSTLGLIFTDLKNNNPSITSTEPPKFHYDNFRISLIYDTANYSDELCVISGNKEFAYLFPSFSYIDNLFGTGNVEVISFTSLQETPGSNPKTYFIRNKSNTLSLLSQARRILIYTNIPVKNIYYLNENDSQISSLPILSSFEFSGVNPAYDIQTNAVIYMPSFIRWYDLNNISEITNMTFSFKYENRLGEYKNILAESIPINLELVFKKKSLSY